MHGHRALLAAAAAAVLITGCGQTAPAPSLTGHAAHTRPAAPAAQTGPAHTTPAAQTGPAAAATCATGWVAGQDASGDLRFFPDATQGARDAARASYDPGVFNTSVDQGVKVTFSDT